MWVSILAYINSPAILRIPSRRWRRASTTVFDRGGNSVIHLVLGGCQLTSAAADVRDWARRPYNVLIPEPGGENRRLRHSRRKVTMYCIKWRPRLSICRSAATLYADFTLEMALLFCDTCKTPDRNPSWLLNRSCWFVYWALTFYTWHTGWAKCLYVFFIRFILYCVHGQHVGRHITSTNTGHPLGKSRVVSINMFYLGIAAEEIG